MAVNQKKFTSEQGFASPNFEVSTNGRVTTRVLDVNQILLNGVPFVGQDPDTGGGDTGGGGTDPTNPFDNITSLTVNGQLQVNNTINDVSTRIVTVQNGRIIVNNVNTGSIENVNIGMQTPGQARFYSVDLVSAPDSTAAILEADGATFNGDITFNGNLSITASPVAGTDITNKNYVDTTALAFSVALGV
jgi:hypothetical protein